MTNLTAEVISIGDEMTSGARLDTNGQWLSRRLGELGIEVTFHSTVGDCLAHNVEVFRNATRRTDVVVATGGLGPTQDDLTRQAMADLIDQPLELRPEQLEHIRSMFARRRRQMPPRNEVQAMFPSSARVIDNPQGTAPGIDLLVEHDDGHSSRIFALPGVPAEMTTMFDQTVAPCLMQMSGMATVIRHHVMRLFGTGESDMEQRLGDMIARNRTPRVGITVSSATISLRITATALTEAECQRQIDATRQEVLERAGEFYFGDGDNYEQHHAVHDRLNQLRQSLLIVELGRAAPLGDMFATLGATSTYRGGVSLANKDDLVRLTDQPDWQAASRALMTKFDADWLLMIDGYPSLDVADGKPLPAADVDLLIFGSQSDQPDSHRVNLGGHPSIVHARIAKTGLACLRERLAISSK